MTSIKTVQFSIPHSPPCPSTSKILWPPSPSMTNFKWAPLLQMMTNHLKENIIQVWLLYVIRSFLHVDFCFQYQHIRLVWLSFYFFSFSWRLVIFLVVSYSYVCSFPKIWNMFYIFIIIHIFSTHFAINLFYLHNLKNETNYGAATTLCMWTN